MKFTKFRLRYWLLAAVLFIASQNSSYAGGFPVRPGSLLLAPSVSYFFANKGWDSLGRKSAFPLHGQFTSVTTSLYAEYGLTRRFTLVASLPYVINNYHQDNYQSTTQGLTDLETGIRYYIANIKYIYYFTVQGTVITPLYRDNPALGYGESGAEIKFSFAGSGKLFSKNYYFTLEDGVRQYFGSGGPVQNRYTGTFGLSLDKKFKQQVSVSLGGFYSTSSFSKNFNPQFIASNKNFAFNQASISYGYSFTHQFSVFVSAGTFISGRNTGDGSSASVSFIIRPF
jgi:hypothetical protein